MRCRLAVRLRGGWAVCLRCRLTVAVARHRVPDHEDADGRDLLGEHQDRLGRGGDRLGVRVSVRPVRHRLQLIQQL